MADFNPKLIGCDGVEFDSFDQTVKVLFYLNTEDSQNSEIIELTDTDFEEILGENGMDLWECDNFEDLKYEFYFGFASNYEKQTIHKDLINLLLHQFKMEAAS